MALRSDRRFIAKNKLISGMLVEFNYTKLDGTTKRYEAIIVDPNKDNYLHGLLIEDLSDFELFTLITTLGDSLKFDQDNRTAPITNLQTDDAYKKYLGIKSQRRYRTFLVDKISSLQQILIGELS